jgi:hypothetical protein
MATGGKSDDPPRNGEGTISRMVEGPVLLLRMLTIPISRACPSTTFGGPPPLKGRIVSRLKLPLSHPSFGT